MSDTEHPVCPECDRLRGHLIEILRALSTPPRRTLRQRVSAILDQAGLDRTIRVRLDTDGPDGVRVIVTAPPGLEHMEEEVARKTGDLLCVVAESMGHTATAGEPSHTDEVA